MEKIGKIFNRYALLVVILLSLPAGFALFVPGFFGASDDIHIAWLYEMHQTLMMGQIPPRFIPDLSFGFGYPLFNFVFPLPFYLAEIFHLLGLSLVDSIKALFFITIPISAIGMYLFLKEFLKKPLAISGAVLYVYTPYRAVDLYMRGAIGEVVAFAILPFIALSLMKIVNIKKSGEGNLLRWIGIGGLSLASLILTHNITAYMFMPVVILLGVFLVGFSKKSFSTYLSFGLSCLLGILISSYFWLPAIMDSNLMKYDTVFNYIDHFPTLKQLVTPYWGYGASVAGPYDGMPFFMGLTNIILIVLGILLFLVQFKKIDSRDKLLLFWGLVVLLGAIFMMNYRSTFLWDTLPLIAYFQFPWRLLILAAFITPVFLIPFNNFKYSFLIALAVIVGAISLNVQNYHPHDFLGRTDEYFLNRYIPVPEASSAYLETQEEYLRLPKDTKIRPDKNYPVASISAGEIKAIERTNKLDSVIEVRSDVPVTLDYYRYNFPGWEAEVNGQKADIQTGTPFGQIQLLLNPGENRVEVYFKETKLKLLLDVLSLLAILLTIIFVVNIKALNRLALLDKKKYN